MTYGQIYQKVMRGHTVVLTSRYGNARTIYRQKNGHVKQKFNNCSPSPFYGEGSKVKVESNVKIEIK